MDINTAKIITLISKIREKANRLIIRELDAYGAKGLVPSHGAILALLYKNNGKLQMKDITERIGKTKSTVTELVKKLEREGFVKKITCDLDRRAQYVILSERGKKIESTVKEISKKLIDTVYDGFTDEQKETIIFLLEKIDENL